MAISNPTGARNDDTKNGDKDTPDLSAESQTWVSAKDADGEVQRIKSEEYPAWEADQEQKRLKK